jgi:hypothetical protein
MNNVELFGQHPEHKPLLKVPEYKKIVHSPVQLNDRL